MMRHTSVYKTQEDKQAALDAVRSVLAMFGNLMMKSGEVTNGFPSKVPLSRLRAMCVLTLKCWPRISPLARQRKSRKKSTISGYWR